jgi:hypothetical protein
MSSSSLAFDHRRTSASRPGRMIEYSRRFDRNGANHWSMPVVSPPGRTHHASAAL